MDTAINALVLGISYELAEIFFDAFYLCYFLKQISNHQDEGIDDNHKKLHRRMAVKMNFCFYFIHTLINKHNKVKNAERNLLTFKLD